MSVKNKEIIFLLLSVFLLNSCILFLFKGNDNAFYSLDDCSVRLIMRHEKDTLYEGVTLTPPKDYYPLLSTIYALDTTKQLGVQIKLWTFIMMCEKRTGFYGEFAKNGLLENIASVSIALTNKTENRLEDITPYLRGDPNLKSNLVWKKIDYKKTPYTYGKYVYFPKITDWAQLLNTNAASLEHFSDHDYIFWIDKSIFQKIDFNPTALEIHISLNDSTGKFVRQLHDMVRINPQ